MKLYYFIGQLLHPFATIAFFVYSHVLRTSRARLVVRNERGELLLLQSWLSGSDWGMPGGGMHKGEDAALAALRELQEETGIILERHELAPLFTIKMAGREEVVFQATVETDKLPDILLRKFEIKDSGWFAPKSLPKLESAAAMIVDKMAL